MQWRDAISLRCNDGDDVIDDTKFLTMGGDRSNKRSFLCSRSKLSMLDGRLTFSFNKSVKEGKIRGEIFLAVERWCARYLSQITACKKSILGGWKRESSVMDRHSKGCRIVGGVEEDERSC